MAVTKNSKIKFYYENVNVNIKEKKSLKLFIEHLFKLEKKHLGSLIYIFCNDSYLLDLNKKYLRHNYYTDIITFDLSVKNDLIEAEIYISLERIKDNSKRFGFSIKNELHRVMFHGALHLCGYKDKSKSDKIKMTEMENKYLKTYFK